MKIRPLYDELGAEGYYAAHGDSYSNPHQPEIEALLRRNFERLDCSGGVLDFCAGGGEVSQVLQSLGVEKITGCDPFTHDLFERQTGLPCLRHSFRDVLRGADLGGPYSLIVSSFALHLCPLADLWPLTYALFQAAPTLVVLTPHKRPELEKLPGFELLWQDAVANERGKQVRLKEYGVRN
jgi:hypothetical protein